MRPIKKMEVGDRIVLYEDIIDMENKEVIIKEDYKPYQKARPVLLANLGNYCSYCETFFMNGACLQTEHVQPKGLQIYEPLQTKWTNFLLSCATCNSKANKGEKDVKLDEIHLPHRNNTFLSLQYKPAGVVIVNPNLSDISKKHAAALLKLVGLDKLDSETDFRCNTRRITWEKAQSCLKEYEKGNYKLDRLITYIKEAHCWSIWFTVFRGHDEVRKALIEAFKGTDQSCFDSSNHYEPIYRNPSNEIDPV